MLKVFYTGKLSVVRDYGHRYASRRQPYPPLRPQLLTRTPAPTNLVGDALRHGLVKRTGSTVTWISPQQSALKLANKKRFEEQQIRNAETERILHRPPAGPSLSAPSVSETRDSSHPDRIRTSNGVGERVRVNGKSGAVRGIPCDCLVLNRCDDDRRNSTRDPRQRCPLYASEKRQPRSIASDEETVRPESRLYWSYFGGGISNWPI